MCPSSVKSLLWLIPYAFEGNEYATPFGRHSLWAFSKELLVMDTQKCHFFILKGYWILSLGILKGFIFPFHSCFFSAALTHKQRGLNLPGLARRKFPLQSDGKKPRGSVQVVIGEGGRRNFSSFFPVLYRHIDAHHPLPWQVIDRIRDGGNWQYCSTCENTLWWCLEG